MPRPYNVHIYDTKTGATRVLLFEKDAGWDVYASFMWSDGNYSCDCNRHIFFCQGAGVPGTQAYQDTSAERECGDSRFFVFITDAETHEVLYADAKEGETYG